MDNKFSIKINLDNQIISGIDNQPSRDNSPGYALYFVFFSFIGANFMLKIFVGEHRPYKNKVVCLLQEIVATLLNLVPASCPTHLGCEKIQKD